MGVHELAEARVRQNVRRGHPAGADVQGQVRPAHRVAEERLHQRAGTVRHDESGPQPGRQRVRHCHTPRVAAEVGFCFSSSFFSGKTGLLSRWVE